MAAALACLPAPAQFWGGNSSPWRLNTVAYSSTPVFDLAKGSLQLLTLTGNVTSSTVTHLTPGQIVMLQVCQDATGARSFVWPANVYGASTPPAAPLSCITNTFVATADALYASSGPIGTLELYPSSGTTYENPGGSGAGRSSLIAVVQSGTDTWRIANLLGTGYNGYLPYLEFVSSAANPVATLDFNTPRRITAIRFYYIKANFPYQGTYKWQASNDSQTWVDVSGSISLASGGGGNFWNMATNATAYRYYRWVGNNAFFDDGLVSDAYLNFEIDAPPESTVTLDTTGKAKLFGQVLLGNVLGWADDNKYDIGAAAAGRPRTIYAGTSVVSPELLLTNLPTSCTGKPTGTVWNNAGALGICP